MRMTPLGMVSMRKAAAMAFAIPGLEVDIAHDGAIVARVERRFDASHLPLATTLLSPCAFRSCVGRATAHTRGGGTVLFLGLGADAEPSLHYSMPFSGAARPLGLVVSRVGDIIVHVFATQAPADIAEHTIRSNRWHHELPDGVTINTAWDPLTEVTLVFCEVDNAQLAVLRPVIEAAMESLNIELGVREVEEALGICIDQT